MKKKFKTKVSSVLVTICLLFSTCGISANASAIAAGIGVGGFAKAAGGALLGWGAFELGQRIGELGNNVYNTFTEQIYVWTGNETLTINGIAATTVKNVSKHYSKFPVNPYDFNPPGFYRRDIPGSYNGKIFKWHLIVDPNITYEWDEDLRYGAHYHFKIGDIEIPHPDTGNVHYTPGKDRVIP